MHDSGDEEALRRLTFLFVDMGGSDKALRIEKLRMQKRTPILKLSGVDDRNAAEALIGRDVYADKDESRPCEEDAWLVSDLVGLEVRFAPGGTIAPAPGALDTGSVFAGSSDSPGAISPSNQCGGLDADLADAGSAGGPTPGGSIVPEASTGPPAGPCRIMGVKSNPAHDILEIETTGGIRMLPLIDVFVHKVDTQSGFIVIDPPAGWLE